MESWVHPHMLFSKSHRPPRDEKEVGAREREREKETGIKMTLFSICTNPSEGFLTHNMNPYSYVHISNSNSN